MHSSESGPPPPAGEQLLAELGQLIVHSRERRGPRALSPRRPSTSRQPDDAAEWDGLVEESSGEGRVQRAGFLDKQLRGVMQALWAEQTPVSIEVSLAGGCGRCAGGPGADTLLLERWTLALRSKKSVERPPQPMTSQWLLNAVRSQLHFSQISAWRAKLSASDPQERQRRRSRETCNYKKLESNCDAGDLPPGGAPRDDQERRRLNVVYRAGRGGADAPLPRAYTAHRFPLADVSADLFLEVVVESAPRLDDTPRLRCGCATKRRPSRDPPDELAARLRALSLAPAASVRLDHPYSTPPPPPPLDDRMLTPCGESGKHRCSCDDESDAGREDAGPGRRRDVKCKRRLRREGIPILQAARFDRLRALAGYRRPEPRATASVGTQTDGAACACGRALDTRCAGCRGPLRRERDPCAQAAPAVMKKHKWEEEGVPDARDAADERVVKRPKLRRALAPVSRRIQRVLADRTQRADAPQSDDIDELFLRGDDSVFAYMSPASPGPARGEYVTCDYGTFDSYDSPGSPESPSSPESPRAGCSGLRDYADADKSRTARAERVPSPREMEGFRWRLDSAACMVFHARTGLPLTSSPAPLRRGKSCFDYDSSITDISGIKSALFHPVSPPEGWRSPGSSPGSPAPPPAPCPARRPPRARRPRPANNTASASGLLGSFEESALNGRLEPVATVHGFTAELGASGAFCPPHRRLPVTVFFYSLGGTNAPYLGHINLGPSGYRVPRSGTVQVSLLNPHGTLVKMFVVLYELSGMPAGARTCLRQRTLYLPCDVTEPPPADQCYRWLRYLIHLRFLTSKTGKLYLHTDIRIIVSRKADLDTATAHIPVYRNPATNQRPADDKTANQREDQLVSASGGAAVTIPMRQCDHKSAFVPTLNRINRVFGGSGSDQSVSQSVNRTVDSRMSDSEPCSGSYKAENVSYELRSFTYMPDNPKYSPR